jgi:hypothetical protein
MIILMLFFMCNLMQCLTTRFYVQKIKKRETAIIHFSMVKASLKDRDAIVQKFIEKAKDKY